MHTSVVANAAGLAIVYRLLGLSWSLKAHSGEIGDIALNVGMQVGMTPYYDLKITRATGRALTVSAMLRDKREAEWLAAEINKALR